MKKQSSSSSQFCNESDLIFRLKQMFLVERLRLKVLKCWLHKRTLCKSLWKQMLRCTDLAHNMFASMHLIKYSIVPTFRPINITVFIGTKGALRRPMTFDNQSNPIYTFIPHIEWMNSTQLRLIFNDLVWTKMHYKDVLRCTKMIYRCTKVFWLTERLTTDWNK